MSYEKYYPGGWQSGESGGTPITPEALNHMEEGIANSAPAGYGLGANGSTAAKAYTEVGKVLADALDTTGIYWFSDNEYANRIGNSDRGILVHYQHSLHNTVAAEQIFYPTYNSNSGHLERKKLTGTDYWQPWDWVDPPMIPGEEYRTTERYMGQPVYCKMIYVTAFPTKGATASVEYLDYHPTQVLRFSANASYIALPNYLYGKEIDVVDNAIYMESTKEYYDGTSFYITVWFCKD